MAINTSDKIGAACEWCGSFHHGKCSLVAAIEYHESGAIKRVEFFGPAGSSRAIEYDAEGKKRRVELSRSIA